MGALSKKDKITYSILIFLALLFAVLDIIFDVTNNLEGASIASVLGAVVIGIGAFKARLIKINEIDRTTTIYIKKNFDFCNILLTLLDLVSVAITLLSGVAFLGFFVNVGFASRLLILIVRFRGAAIPVLGWAIIHLINKNKRRNRMEIKKTKVSMPQWVTIFVAIIGVAYGVLSYFIPEIAVNGDQLTSMLSGLGIAGVTSILGVFTKAAEKTQEELDKTLAKKEKTKNGKLDKLLSKNPEIIRDLQKVKAEQEAKVEQEQKIEVEKSPTVEPEITPTINS